MKKTCVERSRTIVFLLFFFPHISGFCQQRHKLDSLLNIVKKNPSPDTSLALVYNTIAFELKRKNPDSSKIFAERALSLSQRLNFKKGTGVAYHIIGMYFARKSKFDDALKYYESSKKIKEELKDAKGIALLKNAIGSVFHQQGFYDKALSIYKDALQMQSRLHDTSGMANTFSNIATVHFYLSDYEKALKNYLDALKIFEKLNNKTGLCQVYNNVGNVYHILENNDKALEYYTMALELEKKMGDKFLMASGNFNVGDIFREKKELDKALSYYMESIKLAKENDRTDVISKNLLSIGAICEIKKDFIGALKNYSEAFKMNEKIDNRREMASSLISMANCQQQLNQMAAAQQSLNTALLLTKDLKAIFVLSQVYESFSKLYKLQKDYKKSYEYLNMYAVLRDSILGEEKNKSMAEMQTRFDTDKKEKEITLLTKNKNIEELRSSEQLANIKKQKVTIYSSLGGITLALTLVFFVLRGNIQKKKANFLLEEKNEAISKQKKILEEKNILITDSIEYAKSMQDAILPTQETIHNLFPDSFILFKPKDVVSGDFYWVNDGRLKKVSKKQSENSQLQTADSTLLAVIDCVGHGVPGAFMALHSYNLLERIIKEKPDLHTSEILDDLNSKVIETLNQNNSKGAEESSSAKYGMDLSLIKLFPSKGNGTKIEFSGARNSLVIIDAGENISPFEGDDRNGRAWDVTEVKADRMYVGGALGNFTNHTLTVDKGSMIYMFTDGYADQKGGPASKKFFSETLRHLLKEIAHLPTEEQKNLLEKTHNDWKGKGEQMDDILVVGVRV